MTEEEKANWLWRNKFVTTIEERKWFVVKYFGEEKIFELLNLVVLKEVGKAKDIMNDIWFKLRDNQFNIIANPKGWNEFLELIEE